MKSKANVMVLKAGNQGQSQSRWDWLKLLIASILLLAGLIGNYYYSQVSTVWRTAAWLLILVLALYITSTMQRARWILQFFRDSRNELKKVYWPTREETIQTTAIVAVMVVILALILWCIDGVLVWLIGWLTGQRG